MQASQTKVEIRAEEDGQRRSFVGNDEGGGSHYLSVLPIRPVGEPRLPRVLVLGRVQGASALRGCLVFNAPTQSSLDKRIESVNKGHTLATVTGGEVVRTLDDQGGGRPRKQRTLREVIGAVLRTGRGVYRFSC